MCVGPASSSNQTIAVLGQLAGSVAPPGHVLTVGPWVTVARTLGRPEGNAEAAAFTAWVHSGGGNPPHTRSIGPVVADPCTFGDLSDVGAAVATRLEAVVADG